MKKKIVMSKRFWEDDMWARNYYQELSRKYPDKWVAIANKHVIVSGTNLERVEKKAKAKIGREDFPVIFIERRANVYKN
jgi:hypothetical protein